MGNIDYTLQNVCRHIHILVDKKNYVELAEVYKVFLDMKEDESDLPTQHSRQDVYFNNLYTSWCDQTEEYIRENVPEEEQEKLFALWKEKDLENLNEFDENSDSEKFKLFCERYNIKKEYFVDYYKIFKAEDNTLSEAQAEGLKILEVEDDENFVVELARFDNAYVRINIEHGEVYIYASYLVVGDINIAYEVSDGKVEGWIEDNDDNLL